MPEQLWFTEILNHLFAMPVTAFLRALHIEPNYPAQPITNSLAMELLVIGFLLLLFILVRSRLSVDNPGGLQHVFESIEGFIQGQSNEIIGHHSEGYTPFLATLLFFILCCNLLGVIPGFESPTAVPIVPLGCAICAFVYYQTQGFKHAGIGYLKHFAGPIWWLAWLMLPIEMVSHLARPLSLTVRLYANMFAGEQVTLVFISLTYFAIPALFMGLHVFVGLLQAYIFMLLTMMYVSGAVSHEH